MTPAEILTRRLYNLQLSGGRFSSAPELVHHLGAMQSQDFNMAKWAIGLRLPGVSEAAIEEAFNKGEILRTHVLRPTWHFVSPENIRWMVKLTAPHVQKLNRYNYNKFGLDAKLLSRSADLICKSLEGEKFLTREEIRAKLVEEGIDFEGIPLSGIVMHAELEALICSGPRIGKQFTYALLSERVKPVPEVDNQDALLKLAKLFFTTRGPATVQDLSYWSGLSLTASNKAVAELASAFESETIDGQRYYFTGSAAGTLSGATFLMPDYDEYGAGYKSKKLLMGAMEKLPVLAGPEISHMLVVNGVFGGSWTRVVRGSRIQVKAHPLEGYNRTGLARIEKAVEQYLKFFGASGNL
jgi:hypothetical protein